MGIDLRQNDQSSRNLEKLVPQRFVIDKIDISNALFNSAWVFLNSFMNSASNIA